MDKETFGSFDEAVEHHKARYPTIVEMDAGARSAVLRTGAYEPMSDAYVTIWPRKDSMTGNVEPERVWAEEY